MLLERCGKLLLADPPFHVDSLGLFTDFAYIFCWIENLIKPLSVSIGFLLDNFGNPQNVDFQILRLCRCNRFFSF